MLPIASSTWGDEELDAIQDIVLSGHLTMWPVTEKYEKAFAALMGSKYCVSVNSGSSANLLTGAF